MTAQDIREKTFEKSKFGGYDMEEVDNFLEEIADGLTASQKETAVLKSKMKVLVDKIEEYRSNESALNQSILAAQKLAQQIEAEAREKADKLIADAEKQAQDTIGSISDKAVFEEKRLAAAQAASAKFIDGIRAMCNTQLKNLDNISNTVPRAQAPAPAAPATEKEEEVRTAAPRKAAPVDVEAAVRSIEASASKVKAEPAVNLDLSEEPEAAYDEDAPFDSTQPFTL